VKWFGESISLESNFVSLVISELIQLSVAMNPCLLGVDHFCRGKSIQIHSKVSET
jgi:hypothetical protein